MSLNFQAVNGRKSFVCDRTGRFVLDMVLRMFATNEKVFKLFF